MRGADTFNETSFTVHHLDDFVRNNHLLRPIPQMVNEALVKMDGLFAGMHDTDTDARLYRKGKTASELRFMGHGLSANRHGLSASAMATRADGHAERKAAKAILDDVRQALPDEKTAITVGADKGYDTPESSLTRAWG